MVTNAKKTIGRAKIGGRAGSVISSNKRAQGAIIKREEKPLARKGSSKFSISAEELNQRIQQKAYELFERRGFKWGYEQFDWNLAEKIVQLEVGRAKLSAKKRFEFKSQDELNQKIQQKAYELYLAQGQQDGNDAFNWYLAEDMVLLENN